MEKMSAKRFRTRRRRGKSKKTSWKMKFASSLKTTAEDNNFGERMALGFARMMSRRGF